MCAKSLQICPALCHPMDCSLPGSSVHGILQARIPKCVAIRSYRGLPNLEIETASLISLAFAGGFCITSATWEARKIMCWGQKVTRQTHNLQSIESICEILSMLNYVQMRMVICKSRTKSKLSSCWKD